MPVFVASRLSKTGDGAVNNPGVDTFDILKSHPEISSAACIVTLQEDIRPFNQIVDYLFPLRFSKIESYTLFIAIVADE